MYKRKHQKRKSPRKRYTKQPSPSKAAKTIATEHAYTSKQEPCSVEQIKQLKMQVKKLKQKIHRQNKRIQNIKRIDKIIERKAIH